MVSKRTKEKSNFTRNWSEWWVKLMNIKCQSRVIFWKTFDKFEFFSSLLSDWKQMSLHDGYEKWRQREFKDLNKLVQKRFKRLMNPMNCTAKKTLFCLQFHPCGWGNWEFHIFVLLNKETWISGCQTFQYVQAFALAYGLQRFLGFVRSQRANNYGLYEFKVYYEPISQVCPLPGFYPDAVKWPGDINFPEFAFKILIFPVFQELTNPKFSLVRLI